MNQITHFQTDCVSVIAELDEPHERAITTELIEQYDFDGNDGRVHFALLTLVERGFAERHQLGVGTDLYSLTERGEREVRGE